MPISMHPLKSEGTRSSCFDMPVAESPVSRAGRCIDVHSPRACAWRTRTSATHLLCA